MRFCDEIIEYVIQRRAKMRNDKLWKVTSFILFSSSLLCGCWNTNQKDTIHSEMVTNSTETSIEESIEEITEASTEGIIRSLNKNGNHNDENSSKNETNISVSNKIESKKIHFQKNFPYASNSKINSGKAILYKNPKGNGHTVCINAGHGTKGGENQKNLCHPDGSPKVTGGSTAEGSTYATAIANGMTFHDGTPEATITLKLAKLVKEQLLDAGYNVLMIREDEDVQLDNIARTVLANEYADCHIAIHWDSSDTDKGAFYISVPEGKYRNMEPVKSHWKKHEQLGNALINGLKTKDIKIYGQGSMPIDLTQTSYSTIPSVDLEMGDKGSDISDKALKNMATGILIGIHSFFSEYNS